MDRGKVWTKEGMPLGTIEMMGFSCFEAAVMSVSENVCIYSIQVDP